MQIVINYKLDNWNDTIKHCRNNKFGANNQKKREMAIIKLFLRNIPPIKKYPIKINCTWHVKNIGSDLDNKSLKSVLDTMQEVGILENDNINHISQINHNTIKDKTDYLVMDIEQL